MSDAEVLLAITDAVSKAMAEYHRRATRTVPPMRWNARTARRHSSGRPGIGR